jgi:hypothetical protein
VLCDTGLERLPSWGARRRMNSPPSDPRNKVSPPSAPLSVDAESRRQGADPLGELDEILFAQAALRLNRTRFRRDVGLVARRDDLELIGLKNVFRFPSHVGRVCEVLPTGGPHAAQAS